MRALYLIAALAVAMVQPATPQTETEQNNQRQQRAFAEHQRRDFARHRFLGYSGSAYGSDLWSSRPRYAKDTRPSFISFTTLAVLWALALSVFIAMEIHKWTWAMRERRRSAS